MIGKWPNRIFRIAPAPQLEVPQKTGKVRQHECRSDFVEPVGHTIQRVDFGLVFLYVQKLAFQVAQAPILVDRGYLNLLNVSFQLSAFEWSIGRKIQECEYIFQFFFVERQTRNSGG